MTLGELVDWPDGAALAEWSTQSGQTDIELDGRHQMIVEGICEMFAEDCCKDFYETDAEGVVIEPKVATKIKNRERTAILLLAHRVLRRPDSPEGIVGMAEFSQRIVRTDPDYEQLVRQSKHWSVG